MFGFLKKSRSDIGKVEGFGKVPALGDFVRTSSPSEEMLAFEGWLARAMERGEERGGNAFKEAFLNGPPLGFVWSGPLEKNKRGLLGGVLLPSRDAVGRRFPIVIAAPLPVSPLRSSRTRRRSRSTTSSSTPPPPRIARATRRARAISRRTSCR